MKSDNKETGLECLLHDAMGSERSRRDFTKWQQDHPEAVQTMARRAMHSSRSKTDVRSLLIRVATVAAIIGLVLTGAHWLGGTMDGSTSVYAAMIEALKDVHTVHVIGWTHSPGGRYSCVGDEPLDSSQSYPIEVWEWVTPEGQYRLYDQVGPFTVWDDGERRYEHQAHHDALYIGKTLSLRPLTEQFRFLEEELESAKDRHLKVTSLGVEDRADGQVKGFRVETYQKRKEFWIDAESNLLRESNAYHWKDGQWDQYLHRTISYDESIPDPIRSYIPPDTKTTQYDSDIDPRFNAWHERLRAMGRTYQQHPLPTGMILLKRNTEEEMPAYSPGRIPGVTDQTGYWAFPITWSLGDFMRPLVKSNCILRVPQDLREIKLNHDLITTNNDTQRERVEFVLHELGLEIVEVQEERIVWVLRHDGRTFKPWQEVKAPVERGDARCTKPGMDAGSGSYRLREILEGFTYYQNYDLDGDGIVIEDPTGLSDDDRLISSASPYWRGSESIELFTDWCQEQFGITFAEKMATVTIIEVRSR